MTARDLILLAYGIYIGVLLCFAAHLIFELREARRARKAREAAEQARINRAVQNTVGKYVVDQGDVDVVHVSKITQPDAMTASPRKSA